MCKATVIFEEKLGKRREGWAVYLNQSRDFTWYSDKQIKGKIASGERINGVVVNEAGEVVMDETFTTGLLSKTGLATYTPIKEDEDSGVSKYFAVVRVLKGGKAGDRYELVSNRFKLEVVDADRLKALLSLISVGGARVDEKGRVVIHEGVSVEEATEDPKGAREGAV
ncbi:hypothetical protein [uncultured Oscillibacter sp.]|uniref:hypothetical protein n=1 Tax=uncultured Oscillibacter sp. TaxID=876091 RepID=UPI0025EBF8C0|nr:hypothetical protein [uncultured Oscillibacter sp.]